MNFSWSYSAYSSAVRCLKLFKYVFIDKLVPEGPDSGDMTFGSALHSAINASLTGQDGSDTFSLYWDSYKEKELQYGRYGWEDLRKLGQEFIRKFIKLHKEKYTLQFAETRLYGEYKGVKFEGTPDFYGVYNGRSSLRDFKTSGQNYKPEKADSALQLYLYSFLYLSNNPTASIETLGYTVFNKGTGSIQDLTWDFKIEDMYTALDDLVAYCNLIDSQNHHARNLNSCLDFNRPCQFFSVCFPKEVTNDNN